MHSPCTRHIVCTCFLTPKLYVTSKDTNSQMHKHTTLVILFLRLVCASKTCLCSSTLRHICGTSIDAKLTVMRNRNVRGVLRKAQSGQPSQWSITATAAAAPDTGEENITYNTASACEQALHSAISFSRTDQNVSWRRFVGRTRPARGLTSFLGSIGFPVKDTNKSRESCDRMHARPMDPFHKMHPKDDLG